jgi:hypothetical protein
MNDVQALFLFADGKEEIALQSDCRDHPWREGWHCHLPVIRADRERYLTIYKYYSHLISSIERDPVLQYRTKKGLPDPRQEKLEEYYKRQQDALENWENLHWLVIEVEQIETLLLLRKAFQENSREIFLRAGQKKYGSGEQGNLFGSQ